MERDQMEAEIRRACQTLRRMRFPRGGAPDQPHIALGSRAPQPVDDYWTVYGQQPVRTTLARPSAADLDHFDRTWPLMLRLAATDRAIVILRSMGASWRGVSRGLWRGKSVKMSHEHCRQRYEKALDALLVREAA